MVREMNICFKQGENESGKRLVIRNIIEELKKMDTIKFISFSGNKIKVNTFAEFNKGRLIEIIKNVDKSVLKVEFVEFFRKVA